MFNELDSADQPLIIQQFNQGVRLISPQQVNPLKKHIALSDMLKMPFHVYFVNKESATQLLNPASLQSFNIMSLKDTQGLTAWDVAKKESAAKAIYHDGLVLQSQKTLIKDELYSSLNGLEMPLISFKYPWFNSNRELIGIFGFSIALDNQGGMSLAKSMKLLSQTGLLQAESQQHALPGLSCGEVYFTEREKTILLQLIRGKTARAIALELNRSQRTIESHIDNMKNKTNSSCKSELIEKLIDELIH
ncbi:MAG: PAS domain-containing protein [Tatlockia sp.]|nr:PAS domain-containing protein [Tatlockia sp.]